MPSSRSFSFPATALVLASLVVAATAGRASAQVVIDERFEAFKVGKWNPPNGWLTRGQLYVEAPYTAAGVRGKALATRGMLKGERFVMPTSVTGDFTYDVDIQRLAQALDTNLMYRVNVNKNNGAQRYYQASIGFGGKGLEPVVCRIQYIEEDPTLERGFTALTLGEARGPIIHRDEWHHVRLRVVHAGDDHHVLSIDDTPVLEVEDHRLGAGRFGGRVGLDMTHWDNIRVTKD